MLDMGFIRAHPQSGRRAARAERQTLFFSATMPTEIRRLAGDCWTNPRAGVGDPRGHHGRAGRTARHLRRRRAQAGAAGASCSPTRRCAGRSSSPGPSTAPTRWRAACGAPASRPRRSTATRAQSQRQTALDGFKAGRTRVLVATDVAARGIDVDDITHVVNFDLPNEPESLRPPHRPHRAGRRRRHRHLVLRFQRARAPSRHRGPDPSAPGDRGPPQPERRNRPPAGRRHGTRKGRGAQARTPGASGPPGAPGPSRAPGTPGPERPSAETQQAPASRRRRAAQIGRGSLQCPVPQAVEAETAGPEQRRPAAPPRRLTPPPPPTFSRPPPFAGGVRCFGPRARLSDGPGIWYSGWTMAVAGP